MGRTEAEVLRFPKKPGEVVKVFKGDLRTPET
jgi:hypothetical protein